MRILYVHNEYGMWSGEETASEGLARLLTDHNHEVFWLRRSSHGLNESFVKKARAFLAGIYNPFSARDIACMLDEIRPDLVQVQNIYPLLSPSIFGPIRRRGIPTVMRCPNYRLFCPNGRHLVNGEVCEKCLSLGGEIWCVLRNCEGSLLKSTGYALRNVSARTSGSILRNVDVFIVQSAFQKQKFTERGIPESRIGIVPALIACNGHPEPHGGGELVTFVGRVSPEKGVEDFIDAARLMPNVPFAVAGSDHGMPGLHEKSPANVRWLGFLSPSELDELYRESRIVVVPSRWYEGFPDVIAQAMAHARPVVAARIGAMTCIVDDKKTGLLFAVGDSRDLVDKLTVLVQDEGLCRELGEAGREKALAQYSPQGVYAALIAVYEKAMRRSPCSG
jgi:glycosyltransferase involved in cell wall biosynthesis